MVVEKVTKKTYEMGITENKNGPKKSKKENKRRKESVMHALVDSVRR
jgi:hypothetical protein